MTQKIITTDGKEIEYKDWEHHYHFGKEKVCEHIYITEVSDNHELGGDFIISELILEVFEEIRKHWGKPITISSGYRSPAHQKKLRQSCSGTEREGLAAKQSSHSEGLALDLDLPDEHTTKNLVMIIRKVRDEKYPFLRMGWRKYLAAGMTAIHTDCAPFYFLPSRPFHNKRHSYRWEIEKLEW